MQLLSGVLPLAHRGPKRTREEITDTVAEEGEVRPWRTRLRPRVRGRVCYAKAKPMPAAVAATAPEPIVGVVREPVQMLTSGGQPLPSLRRFPPRVRRSSSDLPAESGG